MDRFYRRGVSLGLRSERLRSSVTGFSLRGSPIVGFHDGLSVSDDDDRVSGVIAHGRPVESRLGNLDVTGVFLTGSAPQQGTLLTGTVGEPTVMDGTSWAMRGQLETLGGRVTAIGEYAHAEWDFDGAPGDEDDGAHWVNVALEPFPDALVREYPVSWTLAFDKSDVGPLFQSLGNPGLPQGRWSRSGESELGVAGFELRVYGGRWRDEVEDPESTPRLRSDTWGFTTSFTPAEILGGERRGVLRWLGMPDLQGSYEWEDLEPHSLPAGFTEPSLLPDVVTRTGEVTLLFQYDTWSWSIGYVGIDTDDKSPFGDRKSKRRFRMVR